MRPPSIATLFKEMAKAPDGYSHESVHALLDEIKARGIDIEAGDIPLEDAQAKIARIQKGADSWTDEDVCYELSSMFEGRRPLSYAYANEEDLLVTPIVCIRGCKVCSRQYRSLAVQQNEPDKGYHRACSDVEAALIIRNDIDVTEKLLATVRQMVRDQGDTIHKRWRKRNQTQRSALIRAAMPDIYPSKWLEAVADVQKLFDEGVSNTATRHLLEKKVSPRKCWLVPYLNVETMVEADRLLQLLVVRTGYSAQQLLAYDLERTDLAFVDSHVKVLYNAHAVVMCEEAGEVGDLIRYDARMIHRGDVVGFPRAQLAFEAQKILYTFLTEVLSQLLAGGLYDPPPGSLVLNTAVSEASAVSVNGRSSYNLRAFSKPLLCDFVGLQETLQSLMKLAHDDMWLVQTDVMYFREKLAIPEAAARYHKTPEKMRRALLLRSVVETVDDVNLALKVEFRIEECMEEIREYAGSVRRGCSMPVTYNEALSALQSALLGIPASLDLERSQYLFAVHGQRCLRQGPTALEFLALMQAVYDRGRSIRALIHLHYIDDLLQSPKERQRIDQTFYDYFSRMLALDEAVAVLKRHLPYADDNSQVSGWLDLPPIGCGLDNREQRCRKLETLLVNFVNCPIPTTKPTSNNLSRLHTMHEAAALFWEELTSAWGLWRETAPRGRKPCGKVAPSFMRAFKDPKHYKEFQLECDKLQSAIDRKEALSRTRSKAGVHQAQASNAVQTVWGADVAFQSIDSLKVKVKTRSEDPNEVTEQLGAVQLNEEDQVAGPTIAVKRENLSIFSRMYAVCGEAKADIKWPDLAAAFVDAGLSAVHTGGSAVTFKHPTEGAIVFHRPHPDPKA
ncbi:hypothetical protein LTR17_016033 [Elasticomyces elasticus]|nr:hypothetical protein LTR17_016033 [Elasticomyces elasticus]